MMSGTALAIGKNQVSERALALGGRAFHSRERSGASHRSWSVNVNRNISAASAMPNPRRTERKGTSPRFFGSYPPIAKPAASALPLTGPPRELDEIDTELKGVTDRIGKLSLSDRALALGDATEPAASAVPLTVRETVL